MIKKDRAFFQYKSGDLIYIMSPLTGQLHTASHKVAIKYVGPCSDIQNHRPPQLLTYDSRWKNFKSMRD